MDASEPFTPRKALRFKLRVDIANALGAIGSGQPCVLQDLNLRIEARKDVEEDVEWLEALSHCVVNITPEAQDLVHVVFRLPWTRSHTLTRSFTAFILNLVSANGYFVVAALEVLVSKLLPPSEEDTCPNVDDLHNIIHETLQAFLRITPGSSTVLFAQLAQKFPHKRFDVTTQRTFFRNVLRIAGYAPDLLDRIFALAVEKLLQIDVEINLEDETDEEVALFELDMGTHPKEGEKVDRMAEKLDAMMESLFEFLHEQCSISREKSDLVFQSFFQIFERTILCTHQSKYTQFVLFFLCSLQSTYAYEFLARLHTILFDARRHALQRSTCAAYIGGFLSRANFVTLDLVTKSLDQLVSWARESLAVCATNPALRSTEFELVFHSSCQAIFYIVCFKHAMLVDSDGGYEYLRQLNLQQLVECPFNPLRMCLDSVVFEFCRVVRRFKIFDYSIITRIQKFNKVHLERRRELDPFFPFDPYLLRNSYRFIMGIYESWKTYHGDEDDEEDEEGDGYLDEDDRESESGDSEEEEVQDVMLFTPEVESYLCSTPHPLPVGFSRSPRLPPPT